MDWDLSSYFTEFGNPTYQAFKADLADAMNNLHRRAATLLEARVASLRDWETLLLDYEHMLASYSHLESYIGCLVSAEAANEAYLKEETSFAELEALQAKLEDKLMRGLGRMDDELFEDLCARGRMDGALFRLRQWREEALQRMPDAMEELAADLGVNGLSAWSRLYFTAMGSMKFHYQDPERGPMEAPMSQLNTLLSDPDRRRRLAAKEGSAKTFARHEHMYAAAINALSGTRHTLNQRRGVGHFLEPSLRQSCVSAATLRALMTAVDDRMPFAREVFAFRARYMGITDPGYADLHAPLPMQDNGGPPWDAGVSLISSAFNATYPGLGAFFDELVDKRWVDHTPRDNKRPGGFCTGSLAIRESRIFMTYKDTLNDVMTLAHEAGHAWHSRILKDARVLAAHYPMTIAETASTFAERVLTEGVLRSADHSAAVKLVLLDAEVEHMLSFLLDLPVRFRFEEQVYERRRSGTLSPRELCALMEETQRQVFGDSLAEGRGDPWFWASKLHFYIGEVQFYNYPYTFGYLLSTAFMDRFRANGSDALNTFERFLALSGGMNCEDLVKETLGADAADPNFWAGQIDNLRRPFEQYKEMLQKASVS